MSRVCTLCSLIFVFILSKPCLIFALPVTQDFSANATNVDYMMYLEELEAPIFCQFVGMNPLGLLPLLPLMMAYSEIFTVASGVHSFPFFSTNDTYATDREQQLIAIASTRLWEKVPIMEDVNTVFLKASWAAMASYTRTNLSAPTDESEVDNALFELRTRMFANIERMITSMNATLATAYKEEKLKAEKLQLPPIDNYTLGQNGERVTIQILKKYPLSRPLLTKWSIPLGPFMRCLHDSLRNASGSDFNGLEPDTLAPLNFADNPKALRVYALSEAIVRWAKTSKVDRVQNILDQVVQNVAEEFHSTKNPKVFLESFFPKLEEEFMKNPEFNSELVAIKNDLIKKYPHYE